MTTPDLRSPSQTPATPVPLSRSVRDRVERSVPANTRRAYSADWRRFESWCASTAAPLLPTTTEALAEHVSYLADEGKAPSTIERSLAAIRKAHSVAGVPMPSNEMARAVLVTYRRDRAAGGKRVAKAPVLTIIEIRSMAGALNDRGGVRDLRDRALILLGLAGGFRRSEIVALNVSDVERDEHGIVVHVRMSKTDRRSIGRSVAIPFGSDLRTCPVRTVTSWIELLPSNDGPLFPRIDRHSVIGRAADGRGSANGRLSGEPVSTILRRAGRLAGVANADDLSGHSLRRSFATLARQSSASLEKIARHAGWADNSTALLGYLADADRWDANPAALLGL